VDDLADRHPSPLHARLAVANIRVDRDAAELRVAEASGRLIAGLKMVSSS
jgi:hypothetical protein